MTPPSLEMYIIHLLFCVFGFSIPAAVTLWFNGRKCFLRGTSFSNQSDDCKMKDKCKSLGPLRIGWMRQTIVEMDGTKKKKGTRKVRNCKWFDSLRSSYFVLFFIFLRHWVKRCSWVIPLKSSPIQSKISLCPTSHYIPARWIDIPLNVYRQ